MEQPLRILMILLRQTFANILELIEAGQYEAAKDLCKQSIDRIDKGMKE